MHNKLNLDEIHYLVILPSSACSPLKMAIPLVDYTQEFLGRLCSRASPDLPPNERPGATSLGATAPTYAPATTPLGMN